MSAGRFVKLGLSCGYCAWLSVRDAARAAIGAGKPRCVVLYYHLFPEGTGAQFGRQLDLVKRTTTPVSADSKLEKPGRYTVITIDDGFQNVVNIALPELAQRGIPATIFMIADGFGKCLDWSDEFYDEYRSQRLMSEDTLRSLPPALVTVGSHTVSHPQLTKIAPAAAATEIAESKRKLENILGRPVALFSFPHGEYNDELVAICHEAGYERVFTTDPSVERMAAGDYVIGRVTVEPTDSPLEFWLKLRGAYSWLPAAIAFKRRLLRRNRASTAVSVTRQEPSTEHAVARNSDHR